ncbi:MAG TPA: hypothetical protein VF032_00055 [Thermoleophilaceae bacterium]
MTDRVDLADWHRAYVESYNRVAGMLMGIRRRGERDNACLKVLVNAATSLTSSAPEAIGAPSAARATSLAEVAGAAWAAREVISRGNVNVDWSPDSGFVARLAQRSAAWGGQLAPALMAASDGEMKTLLYEGAVPELEAAVEAGRHADAAWLVQPAFKIDNAGAFLAELNAAGRPRPPAVHEARARTLDAQIATAVPHSSAHISAHAFAVHDLTGIYGPGEESVRKTMLGFVATNPPGDRATLQASKVAALLSDALGQRARMALLDHILILLGPSDGDPAVRTALARDSALVLLMLEVPAVEPDDRTDVSMSTAGTDTTSRSRSPETPFNGGDATNDTNQRGTDAIAEIAAEAERTILAAAAERQARYQRTVDAGSLAGALAIVRDAAAADDHEQAWALLQDIASRHRDADPADLVTVAQDVLGPVPLDSDADFDGPGAGCFTVLSPVPAQAAAAIARVAPRLLNVDDRGIEHPDSDAAGASGAYTPNYLHDIRWCDRAAQVALDTKGAISAPMGRTMVAILTDALVDDRVPALITGWIPTLDDAMARWDGER